MENSGEDLQDVFGAFDALVEQLKDPDLEDPRELIRDIRAEHWRLLELLRGTTAFEGLEFHAQGILAECDALERSIQIVEARGRNP